MIPAPSKLLSVLVLLALPCLARAEGNAASASATVVWTKGQEKQRIVLTWNGEVLRIDQPEKRFAVLYRERDGLVTGLEIRDGVYWKFEWPKLEIILKERKAVAAHYAGESGLLGEEMTKPLPAEKLPPAWTYRPDPANPKSLPDRPFYLETPKERDKPGLVLVARCAPTEDKAQTALWLRFTKAADIVRTVALREAGPSGLADAVASLAEKQATPIEFRTEFHGGLIESVQLLPDSWKTGADAVDADDPGRFAPPKSFHETGLTPLEDLLGTAPAEKPSGPAPTADLNPGQSESDR